jgi:hypothetical protein
VSVASGVDSSNTATVRLPLEIRVWVKSEIGQKRKKASGFVTGQ